MQEAFYIYQELGDKFTWTVRLHNGLAACQMRMGRWEDAEGELLQVSPASKRARQAWQAPVPTRARQLGTPRAPFTFPTLRTHPPTRLASHPPSHPPTHTTGV